MRDMGSAHNGWFTVALNCFGYLNLGYRELPLLRAKLSEPSAP